MFRIAAALWLRGADSRLSARDGASPLAEAAGSVDKGTWRYRQYAVHATVMVGSIPIFSKQNVGGAAMALEEAQDQETAVTGLQLTAGSWPERLKGFNRYGLTQEVVREEKGAVTESAYVSFMATSREKGLADARKAFASQTGTQMFTVARGRATNAGCAFALQHRTLDAKYTWCNSMAVLDQLAGKTPLAPEERVANYGPGCLPTFLFAVRRAIVNGEDSTSAYVHNGKVYRLRMRTKADEDSGLRVMTGVSVSAEEREEGGFRIWFSPQDPTGLPCKIEFRAKSFLKLTLETDRSASVESLQPLLRTIRGTVQG